MSAPESITCPRCGARSHHPKDIQERYCGRCHQFHDLMADEVTVAELARELKKKAAELEIVLTPATVFQLTGLVQLALRHPGVSGNVRETAARFLAGVRAYFADCPAVLEVIRRGDDPDADEAGRAARPVGPR